MGRKLEWGDICICIIDLNQSVLKEINPEYSLEALMLKSKPQYFGNLMQRVDSLEKTLMLGRTEGRIQGDTEDEVIR